MLLVELVGFPTRMILWDKLQKGGGYLIVWKIVFSSELSGPFGAPEIKWRLSIPFLKILWI